LGKPVNVFPAEGIIMQKLIEYSEAIKTKYPEQVVIVISKDQNGKYNTATVGWAMPVSFEPPMWAIALAESHYTTDVIRFSRSFCLSFPSEDMTDAALFYGSRSGREIDKFAEFPSETEPARHIDSLLLTESVANFECLLESELAAGDHVLFVARIIASYINTQPRRRLYTTGPGHRMGAVSYR
jgi:flavin reductase (DIM6/NTAB) family NADH-FMN oxidoreductase RutF